MPSRVMQATLCEYNGVTAAAVMTEQPLGIQELKTVRQRAHSANPNDFGDVDVRLKEDEAQPEV